MRWGHGRLVARSCPQLVHSAACRGRRFHCRPRQPAAKAAGDGRDTSRRTSTVVLFGSRGAFRSTFLSGFAVTVSAHETTNLPASRKIPRVLRFGGWFRGFVGAAEHEPIGGTAAAWTATALNPFAQLRRDQFVKGGR